MANETNGVTPQISSQTLAAADANVKSSAASEETNKTLTGVHSIIIDLEELEREYYETADNYFEAAQELFGSILDSLVALQEVIVSTNEEDKKAENKKPKSISKTITIDQVIQYNDSSAAAAVLLCNKLDALFGKDNKKEKGKGGDGGLEKILQAAGAGAGALLIIAGSMLLFAGGAALFDKVNWSAALAGVAFFAIFVAGVLAISIALKKEAKNLKQFAKNILMMTGALALFAATIWFMGEVNKNTDWGAVLKTLGLFAAFVAAVVLISKFLKQEEGSFKDFAIGTLLMIAGLVIFTGALLFITWIYDKLDFKAIGIVTGMFLVFVLAIALIAKIANSNMSEFMKFGVTIAIMTGSLMLFALALKEIQTLQLLENLGSTLITLGLFISFVAIMALIANLANTQMAQFALFAVAIVLMTGSLMLFALALKEIQTLNLLENLSATLITLGLFIGFVVLMALIANIANTQIAQFALFAVVTVLMIGALMLFALAIKVTSSIDVKNILMSMLVVGTMVLFIAAVAGLGWTLLAMAPVIFPGLAVALAVSVLVLGVVATFAGVTALIQKLEIDKKAFDKLNSIETLIKVIANINWQPFKMLKAAVSMAPAFAAIGMVSLMVNCLQGISKLEIDDSKIESVMDIIEGLIETLSENAEEMKDLGLEASLAIGVALDGVTKAMLNLTEVIQRLQDIDPKDVKKATINLQYIMSKLFLAGTDPLNEPTLMDVLMAVPEMSEKAVEACGALPNVTMALNNIADVILKVKDLSPKEVESAVASVLAMADCLANCSGFFKAIADNSSYGGFLGFGKKDTFKTVDEKMDSISGILSKIIDVFGNLGGVDPAGVEAISGIFSRISRIDKSFVEKSGYFADGLNHIADAKVRGIVLAFNGLNPNDIPLAQFIISLKPVEEVDKAFVNGAKNLRDGINYIADSRFKDLDEFKIQIAEINSDPFTRLATSMDAVVSNALKLRTINNELGKLSDHLKDVYNASSKFKQTFDLGSITTNAIDRAHSWLEGIMNKGQGSSNNGTDNNDKNLGYISNYLQDGNDITRKMLNLLDKWEIEGVLIRKPEDNNDKKKQPKQAPVL